MAELGSLNVSLTAEGLAELLDSLKKVEASIKDVGKSEETLNNKRKRFNAEHLRDLQDLAKKEKIAEAERTKETKNELEKREKEYQELYNKVPKLAEEAADKQIAAEKKLTRETENENRKRTAALEAEAKKQTRLENEALRGRVANYNKYYGKPLGSLLQRGAQTAGLMVGGAVSLFAGTELHSAYEQEKELHAIIGQVVRASNVPNPPKGFTPPTSEGLMAEVRTTSQELGMSPVDVAQGYLAIARHGRPELAKTFGKEIARISFAEPELSPEDLADSLQTLARQNPHASEANLRNLLMHAVGQGKQYNLPINEMAKSLGAATASATLFGGPATSNMQASLQNQLMGMMQIAREGGATSAPEAAMAIKSFYGEIAKAASSPKRLAKAGLTRQDIMDQQGQLLPPNQIIETVLQKTRADIGKLEGIVSQRGMRLIQGLLPTYKQEGIVGVDQKLRMTEKTTASDDLIARDIAQRQKDEALQIAEQKNINELALNINKHFPDLVSAMRTLGGIESNLTTNLITTIGGTVVGSALGAGVGKLLSNLVTANMRVEAGNVIVSGGIPGLTPRGPEVVVPPSSGGGASTLLPKLLVGGAGTSFIANLVQGDVRGEEYRKAHPPGSPVNEITWNDLVKGIQDLPGEFRKVFEDIKKDPIKWLTTESPRPNTAGPLGSNLPGQNK